MYKEINKCRVCGSKQLKILMDLGSQALTGVFPKSAGEIISSGPVQLVRCSESQGCGLVQLKQSYNLEEMYGLNYGYRSGLNPEMVTHLGSKVTKILESGVLASGDFVLDIGSNDGTTLRKYPPGKFNLVGIDPTGVKFSKYYPEDITLISDFFSEKVIRSSIGDIKAKIITSFSMFYDLEDPVSFAKEIEATLHDDGIWYMEQSYLPTMLSRNAFDTICHEHLEFYGLKQIVWIASASGLIVKDVELNDVNGGSFSVELVKKGSSHFINKDRIAELLKKEDQMGLNEERGIEDFRERVKREGEKLIDFLKTAKKEGKTVVGLGASTKGNVLLQYWNITTELLSAIGEVNQEKFGAYTPGTLIPLISEDELLKINPDYILILPWHFKKHFINSKKFSGRTLVFPLPELTIHYVN